MASLLTLVSLLCAIAMVTCQVTVPAGPQGGKDAAKAIEIAGMAIQVDPGDMTKLHTLLGTVMDNIQAVILANSPSATSGAYGGPGPLNFQSDEDLSALMMQGVGNGFRSKAAGTSG